jgi:hypothetical protein
MARPEIRTSTGPVGLTRVLTAGTCLVLVVLGFEGCTVPLAGEVAVGLSSAGAPAVAIAICDHHIDGVSIAPDGDDDAPKLAELHFEPALAAGVSQWSLVSDGTGHSGELSTPLDVSAISRTTKLLPWGWTDDDSYSLDGPTFTASDLAALKPGQFIAYKGESSAVTVIPDIAQWATQVCSDS